MIKLIKLQKPSVLVANDNAWTKEYLTCLKTGVKPSKEIAGRYNHPEIKRTLEKETHKKCAYCESKIKHVSFGDIEHILPKNADARPELYVEWSNLTLSCEQCNRTGKRDYYDPVKPLINPYHDEPNTHFQILGPLILHKNNDERAFITENKIKLNRADLVQRRHERIESVSKLLFSWENATGTIKEILCEQLHQEYEPSKEYSCVIKHFLIARGFPVQ